MAAGEEENKTKSFKLLGILDVRKVPCSREAILHGSGGFVVAGLLHFLATSRVKRSVDVGVAGFILTTMGSWFYCRFNNARTRAQQRMIQHGLRNKIIYEGTVLEPKDKPRTDTRSGPQ